MGEEQLDSDYGDVRKQLNAPSDLFDLLSKELLQKERNPSTGLQHQLCSCDLSTIYHSQDHSHRGRLIGRIQGQHSGVEPEPLGHMGKDDPLAAPREKGQSAHGPAFEELKLHTAEKTGLVTYDVHPAGDNLSFVLQTEELRDIFFHEHGGLQSHFYRRYH